MTRHRFDAFSAIAGLLCLGLAAAIGLRTAPIGLADLQLIGPVAVLLLGVALLVAGGRDTTAAADPPRATASQPERDQAPAHGESGHGGDGHGRDG